MRFLATFLALLASVLSPAGAAPVDAPHSRAELIPETLQAQAGRPLTLALRIVLDERWHAYWKNPGDSGMPANIAWTLPHGWTTGPIQWPAPRRIEVPPLVNYGYQGEVWLLTELRAPADWVTGTDASLEARADWLVCKEICIPASADFSLSLPVADTPASADPQWSAGFAQARSRIPATRLHGWTLSAYREHDGYVIRAHPHDAAQPELKQVAFFPERAGVIDHAREQRLYRSGSDYLLTIAAAPQPIGNADALRGVIVAEPALGGANAVELAAPLEPAPAASRPTLSLWTAVGLALVGGLILNLMPCVFPVLAIKVLGVAQQAHVSRGMLRTHGVLFAVGVLVSFWVIAGALLALRAQGAGLGWGYQLQSPAVVTGLAILFFVLALNLSGVYHIGAHLQSAGPARLRHPHADALASGLLATIVATPCTAPFMGAALGYALIQPASIAVLVFTALAVGMALPYVALCFAPHLIRRLPRPGPWMETLRQLLAFPLYASVVWLVWVLGRQLGIDAAVRLLIGLTVIAAALWALGRWSSPAAESGARWVARFAAVALVTAGIALAWPKSATIASAQNETADGWKAWSEQAVHEALAKGQPVFVDFTAAWCVTCQVNKQLVLRSETVRRRFDAADALRLRADWTNRDPAITAALQRLERSGVPVYALYLPTSSKPILLPEVLTRRIVLDALDRVPARTVRTVNPLSNERTE